MKFTFFLPLAAALLTLPFAMAGETEKTAKDKSAPAPAAAAEKAAESLAEGDEIPVAEQTKDRWVVILAACKKFPEAKADAEAIAKAGKIPFSMNGMIFDKKGLRMPEDSPDPAYAGEYLLRRFNSTTIGETDVEEHISVEKSEAYEGFAPGFYIVVASIAETSEEAAKQLERFKPFAPQAYVKKTPIYLGCIH